MRRSRAFQAPHKGQSGFSMVEMLMTAFILAVGILGLTMLQTMSLKASRGSRSMSVAVLVAEQVLDQVEMEGRLSWLNEKDRDVRPVDLAVDLPNLRYITLADGTPLVETFNSKGGAVDPASPDPAIQTPFFTATVTRVPVSVAQVSRLSDVSVQVQFVDEVDQNSAPITRTVLVTRRIVHG